MSFYHAENVFLECSTMQRLDFYMISSGYRLAPGLSLLSSSEESRNILKWAVVKPSSFVATVLFFSPDQARRGAWALLSLIQDVVLVVQRLINKLGICRLSYHLPNFPRETRWIPING